MCLIEKSKLFFLYYNLIFHFFFLSCISVYQLLCSYFSLIYVLAPLRPPTNVRVDAISPTSVAVSWRGVLPSTEEEPIKGYKVIVLYF